MLSHAIWVKGKKQALSALSEAEEQGWEGGYFARHRKSSFTTPDGYIPSSPPNQRNFDAFGSETEPEPEPESALDSEASPQVGLRSLPEELEDNDAATFRASNGKRKEASPDEYLEQKVAEVVIFDYGVAVFLGFEESQERSILEDLSSVSHTSIL